LVVDAVNDTLKAIAASLSIFCLLVVTPIVTLYLLNDWDGLIATIDRSVPVAQRETVRTLSREIDDTLAGFLRGQGTICLILALYYASALRLIGLNHGLLIGLVAGLISFIPYLGSLIGLVLSLCVVVLQFWPSWTLIPVVLGIFVAGQAIADYALAPYLIASRINLILSGGCSRLPPSAICSASSASSSRCRSPPRSASSSDSPHGNICSIHSRRRMCRRRLPCRKRLFPRARIG
jgi:predicted PurR-regulated permease PerM